MVIYSLKQLMQISQVWIRKYWNLYWFEPIEGLSPVRLERADRMDPMGPDGVQCNACSINMLEYLDKILRSMGQQEHFADSKKYRRKGTLEDFIPDMW